MNSLGRVWKCSSLSIKTHVPSTGNVCPTLWCKIWTFLVADINTLEANHMRCQRQILDVRRLAHVSTAEVLQRSGFSTIGGILRNRRLSLFGRVARLDPGVPAHDALRLMVDTYEGRKQMASWRRPPGRPHNKAQEDANAVLLSTLWRSERNGPLGLYTTTTTTTMMMRRIKDERLVKLSWCWQTHATPLEVSQGHQTWYHSIC